MSRRAASEDLDSEVQDRGRARPGRGQRFMRKVWWLHSFGALAFGVGVMLFARQGLQYADKILAVLGLSWLLIFVAFRFIVGSANVSPDERAVKRGIRLITNYVIKQLYQQMFFFLVPLYAASATWSLTSQNWWIAPILLTCAVLSTMDLVFDNFIMEYRILAASMYGLCLFAVLNLILPLVFGIGHFTALMVAAASTAPAVALLSFRLRAVVSARGILVTVACAGALVLGGYYGRRVIPPAPMAMKAAAVGHGQPGEYECVPGPTEEIPADQLDQLRCVTELFEPGGVKDEIVHVWRLNGRRLTSLVPRPMPGCKGLVLKSHFEKAYLPESPLGRWSCTAETEPGQLVGRVLFSVVEPAADLEAQPSGADGDTTASPADAAPPQPDAPTSDRRDEDASPAAGGDSGP